MQKYILYIDISSMSSVCMIFEAWAGNGGGKKVCSHGKSWMVRRFAEHSRAFSRPNPAVSSLQVLLLNTTRIFLNFVLRGLKYITCTIYL